MTARPRTEPLDKFVKVPEFVHAALGEGRLTPTALALYVVLRSYRNSKNGGAWPSLGTLAKAMNMKNPKNLDKYIKELKAIGAIVRVNNPAVRLTVTYVFPENGPTATTEEAQDPDIIEETGTSADTGTSGGTGWGRGDENDLFSGATGTSGDTAPVPVEIPTGTSGDTATSTSGDTQTRQREPDRGTRKIERSVDTVRRPLRSAEPRASQPPLMQSLRMPAKTLGPGQPRAYLEAKLGHGLDEAEEAVASNLHARGKSRYEILSALQSLGVSA